MEARKVLVVEDEKNIRDLVCLHLGVEGYECVPVADGKDAMLLASEKTFDLIILDLMLPGMDGLAVCSTLRANPDTAGLPIVILTARGEESDRVSGLEIGADDYVTKPFSPREIVARVAARLRRQPGAGAAAAGILRYGPIAIDAERHHATLDGREIKLTAKEFLLLQYLIQHRGRVLSRDLLLTDVWGYQYTGGTRTVDVHIRRLREKLPLLNDAIETIKQFGYKLV